MAPGIAFLLALALAVALLPFTHSAVMKESGKRAAGPVDKDPVAELTRSRLLAASEGTPWRRPVSPRDLVEMRMRTWRMVGAQDVLKNLWPQGVTADISGYVSRSVQPLQAFPAEVARNDKGDVIIPNDASAETPALLFRESGAGHH